MRPIVIVAPDYTHSSNGIRALHDLCHQINMMGGTARMLLLTEDAIKSCEPPQQNPDWNTPTLEESERHFLEDGIVIYPEVVKGNPLNAKRVARWIGNKDGVLREGEGMDAGPNDFLIAHSRVLCKNPNYVLFYSYVNPCFNDDESDPEKRVLNATYIGKGYLYGQVGILKKTLWIDRKWPCTQEQLAFLLKYVACFYTWDCWSQTNVDAVLCGCVPFFLNYNPFTSEEIDSAELGRIPRLDADNKVFDLDVYTQQRADLIKRIAELQASWDSRIKGMLDKLQAHFGE